MTRQPTDYPLNYGNGWQHPHDRPHDVADGLQERAGQVADQALQYAEMAQDAVKQFKQFVQKSLKEQPMVTLASFVLVGFVLGAMWKK